MSNQYWFVMHRLPERQQAFSGKKLPAEIYPVFDHDRQKWSYPSKDDAIAAAKRIAPYHTGRFYVIRSSSGRPPKTRKLPRRRR